MWKGITTDPYDAAQRTSCTNVLTCATHGVDLVTSYLWNEAKAATDDVKGIVDLVKDPSSLGDALTYIRDHPGDALRQLVWDDETVKEWNRGNYLGAFGRATWNIGSWFIPGVDIAKGLSKVGKLGKLGKLGKVGKLGKLGKLADDSGKAARRAEQLADKGDAPGAKKAADEAKRNADDAKKEARKSGCKIVGLAELARQPLLPVSHLGRYAASVPVALPAQSSCDSAQIAQDASTAAREAADRAARESDINQALTGGRYEDADNLIDKARDAAKIAAERAKARPTPGNQRAARKAARAAELANKRVINQKISEALKSTEAGYKQEGEIGQALRNNLVNFQKEYREAVPSGQRGRRIAEVDVETRKAIIESASSDVSKGKAKQINTRLRNSAVNPSGKPILVYAPRMTPRAAKNLENATGATVVHSIPELKNKLRSLGESVS